MDWNKIATLLDIVDGCRNEPRLRPIRDAAMVELLRMTSPAKTIQPLAPTAMPLPERRA